jgi:hypothetical protein
MLAIDGLLVGKGSDALEVARYANGRILAGISAPDGEDPRASMTPR